MSGEQGFLPPWQEARPASRQRPRRTGRRLLILLLVALGLGLVAAAISRERNGSFTPLVVNVASKVVPLLGDHVPALPSPFGKLHIRSKREAGGNFVEISCSPCRMASEKIGPDPYTLPEGKVSGIFERGNFHGAIEAEGVRVPIEGFWDGRSFSGTFELPETPIAKLYSLVRSIVPETTRASIEGNVSGTGSFRWPEAFLRWRPVVKKMRVGGLLDLAKYSRGDITYFGEDADEKRVPLKSGEGTEHWIPTEGLGKHLAAAVVAAEDGSFWNHPGFDVWSMDEALRENDELKRLRRGASTITQQLAKNLFLCNEKTYSRKLRELLYAVNLEQLGKKRILELYLNIVEWGPGIHGAKAAAATFFQKSPDALLPEEAAWLAAIVRSPRRSWKREYLTGKPNAARIEKILRRMASLSPEERDAALSRPVVLKRPASLAQ